MEYREYGNPASELVLIQPVDRRELAGMERELEALNSPAGRDFRLLAVEIEDWNRDLSPWTAPPVFGREAFGGGARATLDRLLPLCQDQEKTYVLGGYSLAGLFALWAACEADRFAAVAAASPSLWFPGFTDYLESRGLRCGPVYLSLGDREHRARNPLLAASGDKIRQVHGLLKDRGMDCTLEWNPGNHFRDPELRTAKAFGWVMDRIQNTKKEA